MPKRKRAHRGREEIDSEQEIKLKKEELEKKLVHGRKVLNRSLKTAKGFERQKLSKRIKLATVEHNGGEAGRLQRELDVLKNLDLSITVESHLYKTLLKSKSIIESGLLPGYVKIGNKTSQGSPEELAAISNVTARLYNTKPVKEAMSHIIGSIYAVLGIQNPSATMKSKFIERGIPELGGEERVEPANNGIDEDVDQSDDPSWDEYPGVGDVPTELAASESNPNSNSDLESNDAHDFDDKHDRLVRTSSDDESNIDVDEVAAMGYSHSDLGPQEQLKDTSTSFSDSSQPLSPPPRPKKSTKLAQQGSSKPGSTFLPTLMGGYWSGSESATDDEDISTRKKNRPGQQARRALWEKKFGAGANHLKGQALGKSRDKDWDPRRGTRGAEDSRFRRGRAAARGSRAILVNNRGRPTGENAVAMKPRVRGMGKKDDAGPLHPSWEAAKKAKEAKQMASFQGKKVVFE